MKLILTIPLIVLMGLLGPTGCAYNEAQTEGSSSDSEIDLDWLNPGVDPEVARIIDQATGRLRGSNQVHIEVQYTMDDVLENGQKVQYANSLSAHLSRPYRLKLELKGDLMNRTLWKDYGTVTLLDRDYNRYAQIEFNGTIEEMLDRMLERFGVSVPLADFFSNDPYEVLLADAITGDYVGLHMVGEHQCHHLALTQEEIDYQIWIDAGDDPMPRKLLITYKMLPGEPQFTATFLTIKARYGTPNWLFKPELPPDCEKIEFLPIGEGEFSEDPPIEDAGLN